MTDQLKRVAAAIGAAAESECEVSDAVGDITPSRQPKGCAPDILLSLVSTVCEFFHDADGEAYARIERGGHREIWPVESEGFKEWMAREHYRIYERAAPESAMAPALATLKGRAKYDGPEEPVHVRCAFIGGVYWIDLCDDLWRAVRVTKEGWRIVERPPVNFIRSRSMRPLPHPDPNATIGDLDLLWGALNIPEDLRPMFLACLVECMRTETPHLVIEFVGQQGTSKSTTQRYARELIDPNKSNLRSPPKSRDDLVASASNAYLVSYENVSHLCEERQDELCRLTTGSGFDKRKLYSDNDEAVVALKRPAMLNGISANVTRPDLLDRTVSFQLSVPHPRRSETELQSHFDTNSSRMTGALLTLFVKALQFLEQIHTGGNLPRMADFARLGEAVYRVLGYPEGTFLDDYEEHRSGLGMRAIESNPIGIAICELVESAGGFEGTVGQLHARLQQDRGRAAESGPKNPRSLGDQLRRLAPSFSMRGIRYEELGHYRDGNRIRLSLIRDEDR